MTIQQDFDREFEIVVPAKGLFGDPPERTGDFEFFLSQDYEVQRHVNPSLNGATVALKNLENMDEEELTFGVIPNGVSITWRVANPKSAPVTGRTAHLTVRLTGLKIEGAVSAPPLGFSPRYERLRRRFFDNFYHAGLVAEFIEGEHIKFADQTIYMGQTLVFLAAELAIRRRIGVDLQPARTPLVEILDAIDQLDLAAETLFGASPALDGFVARDNITGPDDPRLNGRFAQASSDWQTPANAAPSGDQIFGLMSGLWFIVHVGGDADLAQRARALSDRLYTYAQRCHFELALPDGTPVARGSDMRWVSSLLHGLNQAITGRDRFAESHINLMGLPLPLNGIADAWSQAGSHAAQVMRSQIDIPLMGTQRINSFAEHIVLMALAPGEVWSREEFESAARAVNHHLAILFNALAHDDKPDTVGFSDIQAILDQCPDDGPRSDLPAETGWQKDNRWIRCSNINEPSDGHKLFNGVDFLMLHNLAMLVFAE